MKYQIVPVTVFQQNCTLLWDEKNKHAAIVDPGGETHRITQVVSDLKLTVTQILLTHGHLDHVGSAKELADYYGVKIYGPQQQDEFLLQSLPIQSTMFNLPDSTSFLPDQWLNDGDTIPLGDETLTVLHCPGHTPGHVVFYLPQSKLLCVGDVLFAGSIGRTDFPQGDYPTLMASIKNKLFMLDDDIAFIPGHGPMSTLGEEKRNNPYVGQNAQK